MPLPVFFHHAVESDRKLISDYYTGIHPSLADQFDAELRKTIDRIEKFPQAWQMFNAETRRCLLTRFPYAVVYKIEADKIIVFGLIHLQKNPEEMNQIVGQRTN